MRMTVSISFIFAFLMRRWIDCFERHVIEFIIRIRVRQTPLCFVHTLRVWLGHSVREVANFWKCCGPSRRRRGAS